MAPEACEALVSFFVLIIITINIDPCHVPGLSLGCPEEGGTVPVSELLGLLLPRLVYSAKSSEFEATQTRI